MCSSEWPNRSRPRMHPCKKAWRLLCPTSPPVITTSPTSPTPDSQKRKKKEKKQPFMRTLRSVSSFELRTFSADDWLSGTICILHFQITAEQAVNGRYGWSIARLVKIVQIMSFCKSQCLLPLYVTWFWYTCMHVQWDLIWPLKSVTITYWHLAASFLIDLENMF